MERKKRLVTGGKEKGDSERGHIGTCMLGIFLGGPFRKEKVYS